MSLLSWKADNNFNETKKIVVKISVFFFSSSSKKYISNKISNDFS